MFSCFKSLNKKFICSICSACLLCMTGISSLQAEGDPLTLGNTTVESAVAGTNMFLTNTLQDHVYSSKLLSIFSKKPFLYVDAEGNPRLSAKEIPDQNKIPFGTGTPTSVFIAAVLVNDASSDESYESYGSYYDDLTWYELDDNSWDKLCVRYPGTAKVFYHVVSRDENIKGTIDNIEPLNLGYNGRKIDILYDDQFNPNTKMLGFSYSYIDKNGKTINNTSRISMNPYDKENADFTADKFFENVLGGNFTLTGEVRQYTSSGKNLNENLKIEPEIYSLYKIIGELAKRDGNKNMLDYLKMFAEDKSASPDSLTDLPGLSTTKGSQITGFSSSTKEIRLHCPQVDSLSSVLVNNNWLPLNIDKENEFIDNITSFVSEFAGSNDFDSAYKSDNLRGYTGDNGAKVQEDQYKIEPTLYNYCFAAATFAVQNNKQDIVNAIDELTSQYNISTENPNGTKAES